MSGDSAQGAVERTFSDGTTLNLNRVGAAAAWTGPSTSEVEGILADVFDASTGTLRFVGVP